MSSPQPALLALLCSASVLTGQSEWPDYRGPAHDGQSTATVLPIEWSETKNISWKTAIHGRAWSSPVIADGVIWLTTASKDGKRLAFLCIDAETGEIETDEKLFDIGKPQFAHAFNSYASPSPVIDGDATFVTFGSPGTARIDRKSKKVVWQRTDLICNHFRGAGSSPIIHDDLLILTMDGSDHQYLIALDKATGLTRWRTDRSTAYNDIDAATGKPEADGDWRKCFSTPIIIDVEGQPQLISPGAKAAFAYDPQTGTEIWTVRYNNHSSASRCVYGNGLVFLNTGFGAPQLLAIDPHGVGDITDTHVKWRLRRRVPKKPSPLWLDGRIYMINDGGVVSCVEAKTGKPIWHHRVEGQFSASLLHGDGRIYAFSESGLGVVFAATAEFESIAENELESGFMASPAAVDGALIVRSKTHLYRIEVKRR